MELESPIALEKIKVGDLFSPILFVIKRLQFCDYKRKN